MTDLSLTDALHLTGHGELVKAAASIEGYSFDSRNATIISCIHACVKHASAEDRRRCTEHARFWGVDNICQSAARKIASWVAPDLQDDDYALVVDAASAKVRKYAAYDRESTAKAALAFTEQRHGLPLAWRKTAAAKLLSRVDRYGITLPDFVNTYLHKAAGFGYPSASSVEKALLQRILIDDEAPEASQKLASVLELMTENPGLRYDDDFVKAAVSTLDLYDQETGLYMKYGEAVDLPEELLDTDLTTDRLEKLAGLSKQRVMLVNGREVDVSSLTKEALAAVDPSLAKLGSEELQSVLPTLPRPDADLLVRLA